MLPCVYFDRRLYTDYYVLHVTDDYVVTSLCTCVNIRAGFLTEGDASHMQVDENPIPSLMEDEDGDWG